MTSRRKLPTYRENPWHRENRYCLYCRKQYKTPGTFKRHVITRHGLGLARQLDILTLEEEAERQRIMAANEEMDDPT